MKKKLLVIIALLTTLIYTVKLMLKYEEEIRSDHIIVKTVEDESRPLIERMPYETLKEQSENWTYDFKTGKRYFIRINANGKPDTLFLKGVNLGVAVPGKFPAEFSLSYNQYLDWLIEIGNMHANVIRLYTILPPDFYKALLYYNEHYARQPLYVLHGVWAKIPPEHNYFDTNYTKEFLHEIKDVIDVIHGRAKLEPRPGKAFGVYAADISSYVAGLILGREWEPDAVYQTIRKNARINRYNGTFISLPHGNPMEIWLAQMLDFAVQYETQTYAMQRPVSFVNWLPLDPMFHNSEFIENKKVREYDNDLMQVDFTRFNATDLFKAGLYATYHVYPYYPDFIYLDEKYRNARRNGLSDHYFAYLKDLKNHTQGMPLIIAEYGLPTSRGISHFAPSDYNQGGHGETDQAVKSLKLTRDIVEAGCAGAIYFEWIDEWFKHNWLVMDFEIPFEDRKLWHNMENPEQNFGIIAMETQKHRIDGNPDDWKNIPASAEHNENRIFVDADPTYFYLAAQLNHFDFDKHNLYIAIDTYDKEKGDHKLPFANTYFSRGFEFLVQIHNPDSAKILVDKPYSVFTDIYNDHIPVYASKPNENGQFIDELMLVNRKRESLTGEVFDSIINNRSPLQFGESFDPSVSHADWYWNPDKHFLEIRLDWHLLNVSDPAKKYVLDDRPGTRQIEASQTEGFHLIYFITDKKNHILQQIPASGYAFFTWDNWSQPFYSSRPKPLYDSLKNYFARLRPVYPPSHTKISAKTEITDFKDGKAGAVSLVFPGGYFSQYQYAFPLLEKYRLYACFGMDINLSENQAYNDMAPGHKIKKTGKLQFLNMHKRGQYIAPEIHSKTTRNFLIKEPFTGKFPSTILYENVKTHYKSGTFYLPVQAGKKQYPENQKSAGHLIDASRLDPIRLDSLLRQNKRGWTILLYPQIIKNPAENIQAGKISYKNFRRQIRLVRNSGYWIAPPGEIFRYMLEKQSTRIRLKDFDNFDIIELDTEPAYDFGIPLTVKYFTPASKVRINGSVADGFYENRKGYILLSIKPGQKVKIEKFQ